MKRILFGAFHRVPPFGLFGCASRQGWRTPSQPQRSIMTPSEHARLALKHASSAAKRGDYAAADRWSRIAERMSAAAESLAALPQPQNDEAQAEALRAELRARLRRLVEADHEEQEWEKERAAYEIAVRRARREGAPMPPPLRPNPAGPERLERIARGEDTASAAEAARE
jgi:hypothetical protein